MCSKRCDSIFLDSGPSSGKTKRLKSMRYYDGYEYLSWCTTADDSVTQGSLCLGLPAGQTGFESQLGFTFFIFLELEFYNIRNNDQMRYFAYFLIHSIVFLYEKVYVLKRS